MNFVYFLQYAAYTLWLPTLLALAIGARRVRGVAPIAFATLLVFALAPLFGVRLTQWLTGMQWSAGWVLAGPGLDAGIVVLALPIGLLAWWRLKALARGYEAKRFSDAQLLAHSWWLVVVVSRTAEMVAVYPGHVVAAADPGGQHDRLLPVPGPARARLALGPGRSAGAAAAHAAAAARLRRHRSHRTAVRPHRDALATLRPGDDDRRARCRRAHGRPRRRAALRHRRHHERLHQVAAGPGATARGARRPARSRRPLSRQRVLLPRRHLAGDRGRADRARRRGGDGPARLQRRAARLRVRAARARRADRRRDGSS